MTRDKDKLLAQGTNKNFDALVQSEIETIEELRLFSDENIKKAISFIASIKGHIGKNSAPFSATPSISSFLSNENHLEDDDSLDSLPKTIGRYKIQRMLGEGGFSRVYLGKDELLDRWVAIKVLRSSTIFPEATRARFEREARATALLSHPNVVPVFETGRQGPHQYIVTAYVPGTTLAFWLKDYPSGVTDHRFIARIMATIADAVEHAHLRGILHRDLKPSNLLIHCEDNSEDYENPIPDTQSSQTTDFSDRLRIADFGLAKMLTMQDDLQTTEGSVVGTPLYMSPEQAAGIKDLTPASDVFSLGVILYELLVGYPPFHSESYTTVLHQVRNQQPIEPRKIRSDIPRDLEAICLQCLRKNSAERYESAFLLKTDLENWLEGRPILARKISSLRRSMLWCKRNPVVSAALVALTFAVAFAGFQWTAASRHLVTAKIQTEKANNNLALAGQAIGDLVARTSRSSSIPPEIRKELTMLAIDLQTKLVSESPSDRQAVLQLSYLHHNLAYLLHDQRQFESSNLEAQKSLDLLKQMPEEVAEVQILRSLNGSLLAKNYRSLGFYEKAFAALSIGENKSEQLPTMSFADQLQNSAMNYFKLDDYKNAEQDYLKSVIILEIKGDDDLFVQAALAQSLWGLAGCQLKLDQPNDAKRSVELAWKYQETVTQAIPYHEDSLELTGRIQWLLGEVELQLNQPKIAIEHFANAIQSFAYLCSKNKTVHRFATQLFYTRVDQLSAYRARNDWDGFRAAANDLHDQFSCLPIPEIDDESYEYRIAENREMCLNMIEISCEIAENLQVTGDDKEAQQLWIKRSFDYLHRLKTRYPVDEADLSNVESRVGKFESVTN